MFSLTQPQILNDGFVDLNKSMKVPVMILQAKKWSYKSKLATSNAHSAYDYQFATAPGKLPPNPPPPYSSRSLIIDTKRVSPFNGSLQAPTGFGTNVVGWYLYSIKPLTTLTQKRDSREMSNTNENVSLILPIIKEYDNILDF